MAAGGRFPFMPPSDIKRAAIICHRNADADAYLSAYAISKLLGMITSEAALVDLVTPEGMTVLTSKLALKFPHKVVKDSADEYDLLVAVDVGEPELLKGWKGKLEVSDGVKVLVDHHPLREGALYDHAIVDEGATSAGEMVLRLFDDVGAAPDRLTAQAILEAVMFDSSHLAIANGGTLRSVVRLLDLGADIAEAKKDLRSDPDYGEVLAKLKGAQRLRIFRAGDWVVATSLVGSFQAHVARALLFMGADLAAVGGETDGEARVSLRATQRFAEKTKMQLGTQVAEEVGKMLGGHGGGHATAASLAAKAKEEEALVAVLQRVGAILGTEVKELD